MPIVIPNVGAPWLLKYTLGVLNPRDQNKWKLRLYVNNYTPVPSSDLGNFTQATFSGYSSPDIDWDFWDAFTIISNRASTTYNPGFPFTWTNAGSAQTIYGYYIEESDNMILLCAEKFATPRTLNPADTLELVLNFTGGTQL